MFRAGDGGTLMSGEKLPILALTGNGPRNLGMCPDRNRIPNLLGYRATLQLSHLAKALVQIFEVPF